MKILSAMNRVLCAALGALGTIAFFLGLFVGKLVAEPISFHATQSYTASTDRLTNADSTCSSNATVTLMRGVESN